MPFQYLDEPTPPAKKSKFVYLDDAPAASANAIVRGLVSGARLPLEIGGAVAGGIAGAPLGPVGAAGGGAVGYGIGKTAADALERVAGMRERITPKEALPEAASAAYEGLQAEALGLGLRAAAGNSAVRRGARKVAAKTGEMLSGVRKEFGERLFDDPGALLSESTESAGKKLGEVRKAEGLTYEKTVEEITDPQGSVAKGIVDDAFAWMKAGGKLDGPQLLQAKQALNTLIEMTPMKHKVRRADLFGLKNKLDEMLSALSGEESAASANYARASLGEKFKKVLPVNKGGDTSVTRTLFLPLMGNAGAAVSSLVPLVAAQSPAVSGAGISALGLGFKAAANPSFSRAVGSASMGFRKRKGERE